MFISKDNKFMGKRKEVEIVKDYGNINVPTSWDEITLGQFVNLMRLNEENGGEDPNIIDIMAALTNTDKSFIFSLPSDFAQTIMAHLMFLNEPLEEKPSDHVTIGGEVYRINYMEKLKFGEYTDANTIMQSDKFNYAALLAILCRKEGEIYNDDYIANVLDKRIEMWNNQSITKVYPLITFFLTLSPQSKILLEGYLTDAEQAIGSLLTNIESSLPSGVGLKHPMTYVKVRWKLRKLRKCISHQS